MSNKQAILKRLADTKKQINDLQALQADLENQLRKLGCKPAKESFEYHTFEEHTSEDDPYMAGITREDDRPYMKGAHFSKTTKTADGWNATDGDESLLGADVLNKQLNECTINEAAQYILEHLGDEEDDVLNQTVEDPSDNNENTEDDDNDSNSDLIAELNKIYTPVLVAQNYQKDISDHTNEALSEAGVLTEHNVISFDDESRMSQLISVCALLIAKKKNTKKWQLFSKAAAIKKQAKIDIQKEEYNEAKDLAQKYLVNVATTNNSSVARQAANDLLPQTNH